jgi:hypothetical protein
MMIKRETFWLSSFAFLILAATWFCPVLAQTSSPRCLEVKVSYTGPGEVGNGKGIHLYLFDTPDIAQGVLPIGMRSTYKNSEVVVFNAVTVSPVYLVAAYGGFDLMGPPPSGTPVAFYEAGNPRPTPIELNERKMEILFTFDDSIVMP